MSEISYKGSDAFRKWLLVALAGLLASGATVLSAQQRGGQPGQQGRSQGKRGPQSGIFHTQVPEHLFDLILARPPRPRGAYPATMHPAGRDQAMKHCTTILIPILGREGILS